MIWSTLFTFFTNLGVNISLILNVLNILARSGKCYDSGFCVCRHNVLCLNSPACMISMTVIGGMFLIK